MIRKKASEIFGTVDPQLKVIDSGRRRRRKNFQEDWNNAGGVYCQVCRSETLRLFEGGLCKNCHEKKESVRIAEAAKKEEKRYFWNELMKGRITLTQLRRRRSQ